MIFKCTNEKNSLIIHLRAEFSISRCRYDQEPLN